MTAKTGKTVLFQGDSITDGARLKGKENEWDLNHQMGHGYAYLINAVMGYQYPEENTLSLNPDVLSILIGINDCGSMLRDGTGSTAERFGKIYQIMLDEVKELNPETKIVLCEPFALPAGSLKDDYMSWKGLLEPLQEKVRDIAERNNGVFIPLQEKFEELLSEREAEYWVWDGVHPTVCGHQVIAHQWMEYAGKLLVNTHK